MINTFPGTTVETSVIKSGSSRTLFDGVFATGGITLSQVSVMTGLEPYMVQNWVKRGFVTPPVRRVYSKAQFARIIIINMLKDSLQIERICGLVRIIAGDLSDPTDDLIQDDELYHLYVEMLAANDFTVIDEKQVIAATEKAAAEFNSPMPDGKEKLSKLLEVMFYAHSASKLREKASDALYSIE